MNLQYELDNRKNFRNIKIEIIFVPVSSNVNTYKLMFRLNREYNLVDYGDFFVPYYYEITQYGAKALMKETYFSRYEEHDNRIKKEYLNKFVRTYSNNRTVFYGYFESISKLNRVYHQILKPYLLENFIPYEKITDQNLIDQIKNTRFR